MMEKNMPNWKGPNKNMKNTKTKIVLKISIFKNNQANTNNNGEQHKKGLSWIGEPICKEKDQGENQQRYSRHGKNEKGDRIKEDTKEQRETDMEKEWKRENPPNYLPIRGQPLKVLSRAITETYWNNAQLEHLCLLILLLLLPFPYPFSFSYFDSFLQVCMNNPVEN